MANDRPPADVPVARLESAAKALEAEVAAAREIVSRLAQVSAEATTSLRAAAGPSGGAGRAAVTEETAARRGLASAEQTSLAVEEKRLAILQAETKAIAEAAAIGARTAPGSGQLSGNQATAARSALLTGVAPGLQSQGDAALAKLTARQAELGAMSARTGALNAEFFQGLARGTVTLSEVGANMGQTIAKFAGWTGAAAAVFLAVDAVKALGHGAQESSSGVTGLGRFLDNLDAQKAAKDFRSASQDLNVPIADVSQAQQSFARVFKSQDDSITAARVSIAAYKLDNISAADSQRFFTGIIQEWGFSAQRLPLLFDQISAAQRKMGARVAETLPALARSSAAVKNTGGDINQLIALLSTAQVASGQTGNVVGTAFSRAASNFYRRPDNQAVLRSFGLDPDQGFTQLLIEAIHKTKSLSGTETTKLARAIGGPQFGGRIFQTLLGQSDRLDKALGITSPEKAKGSAQDELRHKLAQVDEQMQQVVNTIERLGAALGQAGAFQGLGAVLKLLNFMLQSVVTIVDVLNGLPAGIRPFVVGLLEALAVMKLIRGTRIGEGLAARTGIPILSDPRAVAQKQANETARAVEADALGRSVSTTGNARALQAEANAQRATGVRLVTQGDALIAADAKAVGEGNLLKRRGNAMIEESIALDQQAAAATLASNEAYAALVEARATTAATAARSKSSFAREAAATPRAGVPPIIPVGGGRAAAASAETAAASTEVATSAEAAALVGGSTLAATARAQAGLSTAATSLKGLGKSITGLVGGLGVFGLGMIALLVEESVKSAAIDAAQKADKALTDLTADTATMEEVRRKIAAAKSGQKDRSIFTQAYYSAADFKANVLAGDVGGSLNALTSFDSSTRLDEAQKKAARDAENFYREQGRNRDRTGNLPRKVGFTFDELGKGFAEDTKNLKDTAAGRAEFAQRYQDYIANITTSAAIFGGGKGGKDLAAANAKAKQQYAKFYAGKKDADPFQEFITLDAAGIDAVLANINDRAAVYGRGDPKRDLSRLTHGFARVFSENRGNSKEALKKLADAQKSIDDYVALQTGDVLQQALGLAETPAQQQSAYQQAIGTAEQANTSLDKSLSDYGRSIATQKKQIADLKAKRGKLGPAKFFHPGGFAGGQYAETEDTQTRTFLDKQIKDLEDNLKTTEKNLAAARSGSAKVRAKIRERLQAAQTAQYQAATTSGEAELGLLQSQTQDKAVQSAEAVTAYVKLLDLAAKQLRENKTVDNLVRFQQAQKRVNDALQAQVDEARARLIAFGALGVSQISTPGAAGDLQRSSASIGNLRNTLSFDLAHHADPKVIAADETAINDAVRNYVAQRQQYVKDLRDSVFERRIAATDDPIKKAQLALQRDLADLKGLTGKDRNLQLAKISGDRRAGWDAIFNDRLTDAQFLHDTAKLSDAAYIGKLKDILKLGHLTKAMRQQILREIYQVENANKGDLNLNFDSLKLPTTYEIRRGLKGGLDSPRNVHTAVQNTNTFHISVAPGQEDAFAQKIAGALSGPTSAGMRSITPGAF